MVEKMQVEVLRYGPPWKSFFYLHGSDNGQTTLHAT